jgi:hypothetical protein
MPDHACDRGAVRLDPGASRSQAISTMRVRSCRASSRRFALPATATLGRHYVYNGQIRLGSERVCQPQLISIRHQVIGWDRRWAGEVIMPRRCA